jgi:hypothetical protein
MVSVVKRRQVAAVTLRLQRLLRRNEEMPVRIAVPVLELFCGCTKKKTSARWTSSEYHI